MLIDTHAHLYLESFEEDLSAVVDRARAEGVDRIVMPAIDVASIDRAVDMCSRFDGLFAMAAIHPSQARDASDADVEAVAEWCLHEHVVAVGETGLDYYWDRSFDERQRDFLRRHIRLAVETDLPVVFHNREAFEDLITLVEEERSAISDPERLRGIFHCFTGTPEEAERIHRAGFLVGIGGVLTFKNSGLRETVRQIPLDWVVLETDAPYLAPSPHRGKRNEPAFLRYVVAALAEATERSVREVADATTANAERLFRFESREAHARPPT